MTLTTIRIVLVGTTHPGNIGATARAMKTMGLTQLYLVSPKYFPDPKAREMAVGADDLLAQAVVVNSLDEALVGCQLIFASSARRRDLAIPCVTPAGCAELVASSHNGVEIAILFGQERIGLTNEELLRCHYHVQIPTNPDFSSLNLAQAVQIMAYELRLKCLNPSALVPTNQDELATAQDVELFYTHLWDVLTTIRFLKPNSPGRVKQRLRRLFNRAGLEAQEVNILRGILTHVQKALGLSK
jgi:tRNA (cytidine32/uridine32-2'-O)-methyltransferase